VRTYDDFSRCTRGFEDWIIDACQNPYEGVCSFAPRHDTESSQHTYIRLEGILERLRPARRELRKDAGNDGEGTCESPTKKARMTPQASPLAPTWACEGIGSGGAPVASPCRNAARLGPAPKDPPPRMLFAKEQEEDQLRELSSPKKRLRDRQAPPSQTMLANLSEPSTACDASRERTWQHKALFNPPTNAAAQAKGVAPTGQTGLVSQPITGTSLSSPAQRTRNVNRTGSTVASSLGAQNVADMVKRIEGSAPTSQDTPVSVFDRIRIFEGTRTSQSLRQPGGSYAVAPSLALLGGRSGSNGPCTTVASAGSFATTGSSLQAPVKPKELFRSMSESAFQLGGTSTALSSIGANHTLTKSASAASVGGQHANSKGASNQRDTEINADIGALSAPPSLFRDASASSVKAPSSTMTGSSSRTEITSKASPLDPCSVAAKNTNRRSAVGYDVQLERATVESFSSSSVAKGAVSASSEGSSEPRCTAAMQSSDAPSTSSPSATRVRPMVPTFSEGPVLTSQPQRLEPCMELRQMPICEKLLEDNYEISDHGDSDGEESHTRDRSGKHVPTWCANYLEALSQQCDIDPDTIFGPRVPKCALEDIFTDILYKQAGKNRPKRARGSSADWRKDQLARSEISDYKSRMGHARSWRKEED